MNKNEFVSEISKKSNLTKKDCSLCLGAITQIIPDALKHGDNINLVGFGKFEVKHRAKRVSFNPQTKKMQTIPSKKVPTFKAGKALKSAIG